jgi:hypothetical protein
MHSLYQSFLSSWSKRGAYSAAFCVAAALSLGACSFGSRGLSSSWASDTETALSQSRWYDAETLLQQGYANNSRDMYVLNNLGLVYQKTGRVDLAKQYYERVISSNTEESRTPYGQELRRIAQTNLETLRSNPFGVPNLPNTRPAAAGGAPATATAAAPTSQAGGLNLPVLPLPTAGAQPAAPRPTAMILPDLTPPAPRPQATPPAPPAPPAAPPAPAPAPVAAPSSGVTTTVVQGQNRTTGAATATAAGVIGASTSAAAASAGRINAQTSAAAQPSTAVQAEISSELQKWATAWVDKDLPTYYGHYVPDFKGTNADNKAWRAARELVITSRKAIQLELKDLKFSSSGQDRVTVDMIQNYQSDALKDSIKKSMTFVKQGGRWLIQSESNR